MTHIIFHRFITIRKPTWIMYMCDIDMTIAYVYHDSAKNVACSAIKKIVCCRKYKEPRRYREFGIFSSTNNDFFGPKRTLFVAAKRDIVFFRAKRDIVCPCQKGHCLSAPKRTLFVVENKEPRIYSGLGKFSPTNNVSFFLTHSYSCLWHDSHLFSCMCVTWHIFCLTNSFWGVSNVESDLKTDHNE